MLHIAALLHDITKEKTPDEHIYLCRVYHIEYTETDLATPALFHAKTGSAFARELFPDECTDEIAKLIFTHTTGSINMNILQKILFLADGIEETRTHESLVKLREYFYGNITKQNMYLHINETIIRYINSTIEFLLKTNQVIDTDTVNARNDLISKRGSYEKERFI